MTMGKKGGRRGEERIEQEIYRDTGADYGSETLRWRDGFIASGSSNTKAYCSACSHYRCNQDL